MDWSAYQICKSKFCIRVRWLKIQLYWKVDFLSWSWSDPMVMWLLKMVKMDQMRQFFKRDKNLDVRRTNRFAFNRNKRHYLKDTCHFTIKPKFKWSISTNPIHFKGFLSDQFGPVGSARYSWVQLETELVQGSTMERKIECILRNNVKTGKLPSESLNIWNIMSILLTNLTLSLVSLCRQLSK